MITQTDTANKLWENLLFASTLFLLIFVPLFRGGNLPLAQLIIGIITFILLPLLLWYPNKLRELPVAIRFIAIITLLGIGVTLIPLPSSVWLSLSGRSLYANALQLVAGNNDWWHTASIIPALTETAFIQTMTMILVFIAAYFIPIARLNTLIYVLISIAAIESVLGLLQYGGGANSMLRFFGSPARDAIGTYASRDHLAGFLAMINPIVLGILVAKLGQNASSNAKSSRKKRRDFFISIKGQQAVFTSLVSLLILLAIVFTRSRGGITMAMLGLFIAMFAFAWRLGGSNVYGSLGSILAVLAVLAAEIGLFPVLDRFSEDPMQDDRWRIFASTIDGIGHFFPFGSGAGTFPYVYPAFQPLDLGQYFINNAHNDFLEAIFEQGILAIALIFISLVVYAVRWRGVWISGHNWGDFRFIQVGAGIGILVLMLHSLAEFNLHISANAVFFAFLAGVFFKHYDELEQQDYNKGRRRRKRSHTETPIATEDAATTSTNTISIAIKSIDNIDANDANGVVNNATNNQITDVPQDTTKTATTETPGKKRSLGRVIKKWEDFGDTDNPFKD